MALVMGNWLKVFKSAGASEEDANKAAEELAEINVSVVRLDAKVTFIFWVLGVIIAMLGGIYVVLFNIASRLPR